LPLDDPAAPYLIDYVDVLEGRARLGLTPCPGTGLFPSSRERWEPDLNADLDVIVAWDARAVVSLVEPGEPGVPALDTLRHETERRGLQWHHAPIRDGGVPDAAFEARWLDVGDRVRTLLRERCNVLVHCLGGLGRSGMIGARLLVELGASPATAIDRIRSARPGAIETVEQERYVLAL
jgi:ADP-ribosyl-[dinitrogen reductase] hydrolase